MDIIEQVIAGVVVGLILIILGWVGRRFLKDKIAIKKEVKKEGDDQIKTAITIKNTGTLSANKGPVFINRYNQFNIDDNQQINMIPISESIAVIMPKDPNVTTYTITIQGSTSPQISTTTDAFTESKDEGKTSGKK